MALGASGIAAVRSKISEINSKIRQAEQTNEKFLALYKDANFQKFVLETRRGEIIHQQVMALSKWITSISATVNGMTARTESFLSNQERLNR